MEHQIKKETLFIRGMHCKSCEILIEENIAKISGIKRVYANYKKGTVEIYYGQRPPHSEIEKAIRNAGYTIGINNKRPLFSTDSSVYIELGFAGAVLMLIAFWLKIAGVFDINLQFSSTPSMFVVVLIGLTAGVSSCMALIGGLVLGISSRHAEVHPEATASQKFRPHLFFNLGRLVSYAVLGGMIGFVGSAFRLSSSLLGILVIFAGIVMFFLGLKMTGLFPRLENSGLFLPKSISRLLGINREVKEYSHKSTFLTGALTFFLPCGFTQAMQIYAISTGSVAQGALIMFLFALGTMPGLLGIGGFTSMIKGAFASFFFKFVAIILLILSIWNISNGYNLAGFTFADFLKNNNAQQQKLSGEIINGEQVVKITESGSGYAPKNLTIKKDIPVRLLINATNVYTCASIFLIPKLNISSRLVEGINEITFTPTETGPIKFSCAMGMYTGSFNVID